jgi:hypothetical protein
MATWIDVMALAESLRRKQSSGQALDGDDAEALLAMLLRFHERAVAWTPTAKPDSSRRPASGE